MRFRHSVALVVAPVVFSGCASDVTVPPIGIAAVSAGTIASLSAPISVSDDFSGAEIDAAKWSVVTTGIPQGGAFASQDGGVIELENRAHLNTVQTFDPANGTVHVTGEWTMAGAGEDFIQILTRSSGTPGGAFGETTAGVQFFACSGTAECSNQMAIGGNGVVNASSPGFINIVPGATYLFDATDDGDNLSFTLTRQSNPSETRTVTAQSAYASPTNLVTFHNRELCCDGTHRARLDNVSVTGSTAPLPPDQAIALLIDMINVLGLNAGQANGFTSKLEAAAASLARGNTTAAQNQLNAFINHVQAQSGKLLTPAQAAFFTNAASEIIADIG